MRRRASAAITAVAAGAVVLGCQFRDPPARPRAVDPAAVETRALPAALPPGRAEAFFALDTGADQAGGRRREAALVLVLRIGGVEQRRTVATCGAPSLGSALGGGTPAELEVALCGAEFALATGDGRVRVLRRSEGAETTWIDLPLPAGITSAVAPAGDVGR